MSSKSVLKLIVGRNERAGDDGLNDPYPPLSLPQLPHLYMSMFGIFTITTTGFGKYFGLNIKSSEKPRVLQHCWSFRA